MYANLKVVVHIERIESDSLYGQVFEYKRLVQDNNRQVRENTHGAMADLTTNAGCVFSRNFPILGVPTVLTYVSLCD